MCSKKTGHSETLAETAGTIVRFSINRGSVMLGFPMQKSIFSKLNSNCCNILGYLSLKYRCSSSKFRSLLGVEIDQNICEIRNRELQFWVAFILCLKMRVQSSSICKSSSKSIGSSIGEVGFLSLHHLYTILGSKYGFSPTNTKKMVAKVFSHHSSSHS